MSRARPGTPPRLVVGSFLSLAGLLAQAGSRFGVNLVIGRLCGPLALGATASALAAAQFLALCWPSASSSAASRFLARAIAEGDEEQRLQINGHLRRRTIQSSLLLALLGSLWWWRTQPGLSGEAGLVGVLVLAFCLYTFGKGVQYGEGRVSRVAWLETVVGLGSLAGVAALATAGVRNLYLLTPLAVGYLIYGVVTAPREGSRGLGAAKRREVDTFVALTTVGTLSNAGIAAAAVLVAHGVAGDRGAGLYSAASVVTAPTALLLQALSLVFLPTLAATLAKGPEAHSLLQAKVHDFTRVIAVTMIPATGVLVFLRGELISVVWGARYADAAPVMPILLFAGLSTALAMPSVTALMVSHTRDVRAVIGAGVVAAVLGVAFWFLTAGTYGIAAVAWGYFLTCALTAAACIWLARHRLGLRSRGLAMKCSVVLGAMVALWAYQDASGSGTGLSFALALTVLVICAAVFRTDLRQALDFARDARRR